MARVHLSVVFDQQLSDVAVSVPGGVVERHGAQRVTEIGIGARVEQRAHAVGVVGFDGFMQVVGAGRAGEQHGRQKEAQRIHGRTPS